MNSIQALISDDSFAISFQSMGQYRAALLKALNAEAHATTPAPDAEEPGEPGELEDLVLNLKFLRQELMDLKEWPVKPWPLGYLDRACALLKQQEAELARLRPAPVVVPVAVGEVLPSGNCWVFSPGNETDCPAWVALDLEHAHAVAGAPFSITHLLPHHAIPLPQGGEVEG